MKEFIYYGQPKKLSRVVSENCPLISYNQFKKLLKNKDIRINDVKITDDCIVNSCSSVKVYNKNTTFKKIYSDNEIEIIFKPKGIASEGDISAETIMHESDNELILCHRLDTNTDGLLIFAKNERAYNEIIKGFKNKSIAKYYRARVYGTMQSNKVYTDYLIKDSKNNCVKISKTNISGSVKIITEFSIIGVEGNTSHLDILIYSGKTHQIRAQLASHGHFILGDSKYGRDDINRKYGYKKQQLTAYKLVFDFNENSYLSYLNKIKIEL